MASWYEEEKYDFDGLPEEIANYPTLALVKIYPNGKTQPGWGAKDFMDNFQKGLFDPKKVLHFAEKNGFPYSIVMRSLPMVCVDIDGKNGGIDTARVLSLPRTLAERSKSGNGYHLFYRIPYPVQDPLRGFAEIPDIVGLIPGVDIKGTGLVYRYAHQRWNRHPVLTAPTQLLELMTNASEVRRRARITREGVTNLDPDELVIIHDELSERLNRSIKPGNRNKTLYAIGAEMFTTQYPSWDLVLIERGLELGLEIDEISEIIFNIEKYA